MLDALVMTVRTLRDRRLRGRILAIAAWTVVIYAALLIVLVIAFGTADPDDLAGMVTWMPPWLFGIGMFLVLALAYAGFVWITFVVVAQNVAALHLDGVIARVEEIDYPGLPPARGTTTGQDIASSMRFSGTLVLFNLLALPFYVAGLLVPLVTIAVFYLLNGWLLGREYAEAVILRRHSPDEAAAWRRANRMRVWLAGALATFCMTVPVLNLGTPVLAAICMTHVFHGTSRNRHAAP